MARKRGGLAGIYDRNKKIIKPLAAGAAGMFGSPLLGALVGSAMGGLDREGKKGIGFDVNKGVQGGLEGYGAGQLGSAAGKAIGAGALKGKLAGLLTGNASAPDVMGMGADMLTGAPQIGMTPGASSSYGAMGSFQPSMSGVSASARKIATTPVKAPSNFKGKASSVLKGVRENKDIIGGAVKGIQMAMPDPSNEAAMMNAETARMRYNLEQKEAEQARLRQENIARLLMPQARQMFGGQQSPFVVEGQRSTFAPLPSAANMYADPEMSLSQYIDNADAPEQVLPYNTSPSAQRYAAEAQARGRAYTYGRK